jgi:glycosyltransferase involved in cell wall biosynthesis
MTLASAGEAAIKGRVGFILYGYGLGNSPSLINAAKMLERAGYHVDFFTCETFLGNISFVEPQIQIHEIKSSSAINDLLSKILRFAFQQMKGLLLPRSAQIRITERSAEKRVSSYADTLAFVIKHTAYKCFIGVEPLGLMTAFLLCSKKKMPFIYYNMELHNEPDITAVEELVAKKIERKYSKYASFTITLDSERARLISTENDIPEDSIVTVPVCAEGEPFRNKTNYLRDKLGLKKDDKIILYAGFIADWAMCEEIAKAAQSWPKNWILVFHSHGYNDDRYVRRLKRRDGERVRFSLSPVTYEELPELLASADIGIALYKDLGANFTLISSASGKIAHYLKCGLPVVVNSYPGISQVVDKYFCGIGIDSPVQMREAIEKILMNYERMQSGAYLCYEERYRFSRYFSKVVDRIGRL